MITGITIVMTGRGIAPFHMKLSSVGPFLEYQMIVVFLVNFVIAAVGFYGMIMGKRDINLQSFISIGTLYLTALYGDMLHRLSSIEDVYEMFFTRTIIVIVEVVISIIAVVILKRWRSKKECERA